MDKVILKVEKRQAGGSGAAKNLRKDGRVPGVVYGTQGHEIVSVNTHDLETILSHHRSIGSFFLDLEFADAKDNRTVVIQELQHHPLSGALLNIDFKEVSMKVKIETKIPLVAKGDSEGLKAGGVLEQHMWDIKIVCLPTDMPEEFRVDITDLQIGQLVHVSDLESPEGVEIVDSSEDLVLAIIAPRTTDESSEDESDEDAPKEPEVLTEAKEDNA